MPPISPRSPGISSLREAALKPQHLSGYLAGTMGVAALLVVQPTEAAVVAVNFGFGTTLNPTFNVSSGGNNNVTVGPGYGLIGVNGASPNVILSMGGSGVGRLGSVYESASINANNGLMTFFADGAVIGSGGNGALGIGYFHHYSLPALKFNSDQLNKNIAFKTSTNNWGWANVSWNEATKVMTVNSAYVETVANTAITVGNIGAAPEPSRALLALAGLASVALRRRRKQVA